MVTGDGQHIGVPRRFKPAAQCGIIVVDFVSRHPARGNPAAQRTLQQLLGKLRFGRKRHLLRHTGFLASLGVVGPHLGQIQFPVQKRAPLRARVSEKDANLAVLPAARGPAVLALYPDRLRAFLKETSLVHDQHAVRIAQILNHVGLQVVTHTIRVPLRRIEQPLHPLRTRLTQLFGKLPAILALDAREQP